MSKKTEMIKRAAPQVAAPQVVWEAQQAADEMLPNIEHSAATIKGIPVSDHEDYIKICDVLFDTVEFKATVAEREDALAAEAKATLAGISTAFHPVEAATKNHIDDMKQRARDYAIECEARYNALIAKAAKLAKTDPKKARELNARAEDELVPKVKGIAFVSKVEAKVLDQKKVPKEFYKLVIDDAKLKAAAEAGEEVPGVVFEDVRTVRVTPGQREMK